MIEKGKKQFQRDDEREILGWYAENKNELQDAWVAMHGDMK